MSARDLEKEMSKFEAELSRLTSSTSSQQPTSSTSSNQKPKINIQLSTSFTAQLVQQQQQQQLLHQNIPLPPMPPPPSMRGPPLVPPPLPPSIHPPMFNPPLLHHHRPNPLPMTSSAIPPHPMGGVKRDASGKILNNKSAAEPTPMIVDEAKQVHKKGPTGHKEKGANNNPNSANKQKTKKLLRSAGGQIWEDSSLNEWDPDDFRLFCGDLGNEVSDEALARAFQKYPSMVKAKVIRDRRSGKTKGYGFVSFKNSEDFIKAMREMNGKYVGNRPIKLRKSNWKDRNLEMVKKKESEKQKTGFR